MTIQHVFGETTIPTDPQRVVADGFNEADFVLALGVVPVGMRDFIDEYPEENRLWAQQALGRRSVKSSVATRSTSRGSPRWDPGVVDSYLTIRYSDLT